MSSDLYLTGVAGPPSASRPTAISFAGERITEAIQAGLSFQEAFPDQAEGLDRYLRLARSVRISLQSNTEFCTGLLAARYDGEAGVESWQRREEVA